MTAPFVGTKSGNAGNSFGSDPNDTGGLARILKFRLTAAQINGQAMPKTFALGFFRERLLILGFDLTANLTWVRGGPLNIDNVRFANAVAPPIVVSSGVGVEVQQGVGFLVANVGDTCSLDVSGDSAVISGEIDVLVYAVTVGSSPP